MNGKEPLFPPLPGSQRHPVPPTPTPTPHHLFRRPHESQSSYQSGRRSSIDTPLSLYASNRARLREALDNYAPSTRRRNTVQVPLSALSAPLAVPGNVGGPFNSTTKFKAVPLPAMYSHHQLSNRGIRSVGLHTPRYVPTITSKIRTVSDSLINLTQSGDKQKEHLFNSENNVLFSRKLQREREITPHRVEGSYYMNGLSAQLFNRDDIPQNELDVLQKMALSQNTHLYYGKGIRSVSGKTAKLVKQFENRLKNCISAQNGKLNYALEDIDAGRYSRTSRAVTPGSPLIEEPEQEKNEEAVESSPSNDTFMTQQNNQ